MAKNIRNQYIAPKYENIVNDIEIKSKRLPFNLTDGFNIKDIELLDKYTLRNGEISDEGMSKIMEKVKFSPFLRYFFRHKYHHTIPKEHMDKLIESTPATEIKFMLDRPDLNSEQIDDVILKYETYMASNLKDYINEYPDKISDTVIEHLFKFRSADFKRWDYAPFSVVKDKKRIEREIENIHLFGSNEKLSLALINNPIVDYRIKEELFKDGCDYLKIKNPTKNMLKDIYASATQMIFDYDYTFEYATKIDEAKKQLQKHMHCFPDACLYDLIKRCKHNERHSHLITDVAMATNLDDILKEIVSTKDGCFTEAKLVIHNKKTMGEKTYEVLTSGMKTLSKKRAYALKLIFTGPIVNEKLLDEFFEKPDRNMLIAMLVSPYNSVEFDNKILHCNINDKEFSNKIETLWLIKQKLNQEHHYFAPVNYTVLADIAIRVLDDKSHISSRGALANVLGNMNSKGLYKKEQEKFIKEKLNEVLREKDINRDVKLAIKSFLKQFDKNIEREQPFLPTAIGFVDFPIFTTNLFNIKLSRMIVESIDKEKYKEMIGKLEILPQSTLEKMKSVILRDIVEDKGYKKEEIQFRIYKIADFYNAIDNRIKEIQTQKSEQSKINKEEIQNEL